MTLSALEYIERDRQRAHQVRQIRQQEILMALKPKPKPKGIPIGNFDVIADEMGSMKIKPKRKPPGRTLNQQYASANRKKYKGVAK